MSCKMAQSKVAQPDFSVRHVVRKRYGGNCPQTAFLPPTNLFDKFLTLFATIMYPECYKWGTNKKIICSLRSQRYFVPHFQNSGAVRDCNDYSSTLTSNYCPLKFWPYYWCNWRFLSGLLDLIAKCIQLKLMENNYM